MALGRLGAGQGDQACLGGPVERAGPAGPVVALAVQGGVEALLDEALADPLDGAGGDLDSFGDVGVVPGRTAGGGVGLEQDAGVGEQSGGGLALGKQGGQLVPFGGGQGDPVLLRRHGKLLSGCRVRICLPASSSNPLWRSTSPPYWAHRTYSDGGIGLEPTYGQYIQKVLAVCAQVKSVLKPT